MGEIVLSQVGAVVGSQLLPNGLSVLGQTLSGQVIGEAMGRLAGRAIDSSLAAPFEGPRIKSLHVMESREGAGLPLVYGRARVGGQVIWASRFKEKSKSRSAGKGGPKYTDYSYTVSFAVALSQGPITRVDRIWANGELITLDEVTWRLYSGTEDQLPDPLIEAIEGAGAAPAYRGTAYIVFEDLPLDRFGNRLPQLSFETVRAGRSDERSLGQIVKGVNIIPATGEFVYATSIVRELWFPGTERPLNMNNASGRADFTVSLEQLGADLPKVQDAALTVAWFGNDLRAGECQIRPGVERQDRDTVPYTWSVDGIDRSDAHLISRADDSPNYGGTPADQAVIEGIAALKQAGISVTLSPFLLMDIPPSNGLLDPYGWGVEQPAFPWRGRIRTETDRTRAVRDEVDAFVGEDGAFGYRHFILHHARLAVRAGGVSAFLIGSEMVALTRARDHRGLFPFVSHLADLVSEVREIVGPECAVSYAANWSEYGSYAPNDGSNDVLFPLDQLWASPDIDFVGVDWYPPTGDWRGSEDHLDLAAGYTSAEDPDYLVHNFAGGEAFDWYYGSEDDRSEQIRTPIQDTAHGEDWIFRAKDLEHWWSNPHHERPEGIRSNLSTAWQARMKPVRLIEIGFPAIDKGTNAPNLFFDPKSSESAVPPFSNGARDDLLQRRALAAAIPFWQSQDMVDQVLVWAWDGRPWPDFPSRSEVWSDGPNWQRGHWLNGRSGLVELSEVLENLSDQGDIAFDARAANGIVEGYTIDGVTSLAAAMMPLMTAFDFTIRETEAGMQATHADTTVSIDLTALDLVEDSRKTQAQLLDKQPSVVTLSYISGDLSYDPAVAEVRVPGAHSALRLGLNVPLVLGEAQALLLAEDQLRRLSTFKSMSITVPPEIGARIEIADSVTFEGQDWTVERIEEQGLEKRLGLRSQDTVLSRHQALELPQPSLAPIIAADPFAKIIDGPIVSSAGGSGLYVAATADPWGSAQTVKVGHDPEWLSERAIVEEPAGLGALDSDLEVGWFETWDAAAEMIVSMPGEELFSAPQSAVLAGENQLLIESADNWELIGWINAELIGPDQWRLRGLRRGLQGAVIRSASAGACVVRADRRLVSLSTEPSERGVELYYQIGTAVADAFIYEDKAGLPWRVGDLSVGISNQEEILTWTPRGRDMPLNWAQPGADIGLTFRVEGRMVGEVVFEAHQADVSYTLPTSEADEVRVAAIGKDGRVGEWASIPLSRA